MTIQGIVGRSSKDYTASEEDVKDFEKKTTRGEMKRIAHEVNDTSLEQALDSADRRSYGEFKGDSVKDAGKALLSAGGHEVEHELVQKGIEHSLGKWVASPVLKAVHLTMKALEVVEYYNKRGEDGSATLDRERAQVALVTAIRLPEGYRNSELERNALGRDITARTKGDFYSRLHDEGHKDAVRLLQFHADRGATSAFAMQDSGLSDKEYFSRNPGAAKDYAQDPAFRTGFEAAKWAKDSYGDGLSEFKKDVESRSVHPAAGLLRKG